MGRAFRRQAGKLDFRNTLQHICKTDVFLKFQGSETRPKASPETALHRYWECPSNEDIDDPDVAQSQELAETALSDEALS